MPLLLPKALLHFLLLYRQLLHLLVQTLTVIVHVTDIPLDVRNLVDEYRLQQRGQSGSAQRRGGGRSAHLERRCAERVPHIPHRLQQLAALLALPKSRLDEVIFLGVAQRRGVFLGGAVLLVDC